MSTAQKLDFGIRDNGAGMFQAYFRAARNSCEVRSAWSRDREAVQEWLERELRERGEVLP